MDEDSTPQEKKISLEINTGSILRNWDMFVMSFN